MTKAPVDVGASSNTRHMLRVYVKLTFPSAAITSFCVCNHLCRRVAESEFISHCLSRKLIIVALNVTMLANCESVALELVLTVSIFEFVALMPAAGSSTDSSSHSNSSMIVGFCRKYRFYVPVAGRSYNSVVQPPSCSLSLRGVHVAR